MRKSALLLLLFIALASAVPVVEWNKTYGNYGGTIVFRDAVATSDGGYALLSYALAYRQSPALLTKTDSEGNREWSREVGQVIPLSLVQTPDGGYAVGGVYVISDQFYSRVVKLDSNGHVMWNKSIIRPIEPYAESNYIFSMVALPDGSIVIAGETSEFYGALGYSTAWVAKLNSSGDKVWSKKYSAGLGRATLVHSIKKVNGGYVIAGSNMSAYSPDIFWLAKLDEDGNCLWNKSFGTAAYRGTAFSVYPINGGDGGYVLAGGFSHMDLEAPHAVPTSGQNDRIVRTDSEGNVVWDRAFNGSGVFRSVTQTSDGGFLAAGTIHSRTSPDLYNFWLLKTDANGRKEWELQQNFLGRESGGNWVGEISKDAFIVGSSTSAHVPQHETFGDEPMLAKIIIVDNLSITIQSPVANQTFGDVSINLNYTVANLSQMQVQGCAYTVDDAQPPATYDQFCLNQSLGARDLGDGSHTFYVFAKDTAGGMSRANVSFVVDLTPPVVYVYSPTGTYRQSSVPLDYEAPTAVFCKYKLDDEAQFHDLPFDNGCKNLMINVAPGNGPVTHKVAVYAWDESGNLGTAEKQFTVDVTTPPPASEVGAGQCAADSVRRMIDDGAGGIIALIIFTTIAALALIYMVAYALNKQEYIMLVKDELFHLGVSIAILILFGMIMSVSCALVGSAFNFAYENINQGSLNDPCYGQGTTVQSVSVCYMRLMESDAKEIINTYTKANIDLQLKASGYVSYYGLLSGTTFAPKAYMRSQAAFIDNVNNMFVIPAYVSIYTQDIFMRYFVGYKTEGPEGVNTSAILGLLLPGAFVLRFFAPTRQIGNMLIAFAVGIYLVIPVFVALNAIMYQYTFTPQDCDRYKDVIADPVSIWGGEAEVTGGPNQALACDSPANLLAVARLYPQAFLLPNITIIIFIAFMTSVNKALKVLG